MTGEHPQTPKSALKTSSRASTLTNASVRSLDPRGHQRKPADASETPDSDFRPSLDISRVRNGPYPGDIQNQAQQAAQQLQKEVAQVNENEPSSSMISKAFEAVKSFFY